jgi:PAS domain S-box-containing protein
MLQNQNHRFWNLAKECVAGCLATALITFVCFRFRLDPLIPACLYLISLILLSLRGSFVSSVVVSFIAVGCLDYYFIPPIFSITVSNPSTILTLITFLTTLTVIARLVSGKQSVLQEKLERGEAYLSEAQRLSHTGSFGWKVATGEILWSEETFRIFQYDPKTKPTMELVLKRVYPEDQDFFKQTIEHITRDGKDFDIEHRLLMPDGSVKHLHVVAHVEKDKSGKIEFIGAVMDVTVAKEAANKIRLTIDTVPGLLWTARPDGWVDFLNRRWLDYTGMALEQGLGWAWQPGYHPDDLGNLLSKWRAAIAERKPLDVEARLRRFDGEYRWFLKRAFPLFDNAGRVLGWYGGNIDIHDLKQAEEALRRNEMHLAEAQRLSKTGSWVWNASTRENVFWSKELRRIYGFDPERSLVEYAVARERVHPEDGAFFDETFHRALREVRNFEMDHRIVLPGGEVKHIQVVGHPVLNGSGELVEYMGTVLDITERKRAEMETQAHLWFLESMDRINRAIQGANDLEEMMSEVLKVVFSIFNCDRAWLVYPCDPRAPTWRAVMEHVRPEFPGAFALGADLPIDPEIAAVFERVRGSKNSVCFGPESDDPVPLQLAEEFHIRSMIGLALYPKLDKPYILGLHQCAHARVWTLSEQRLFQAIGRRMEDALSALLMFRSLQNSEARLEEAQRIAHVGHWERDLDTGLITWSNEVYRIYGLAPQARILNLSHLADLLHPEDRQIMIQAVADSVNGVRPYNAEFRIIRPSGEVRFVHSRGGIIKDETGRPRRHFGTIQDITERKLAEEALRRNETYLAEAQKLSQTGSWARNSATGTTVYWSEECRRLMGYEPNDEPPSFETYLQRVHPDDRARIREIVATAGRKQADYQMDYRLIHPGGEIRDIHTIGHPVFSPTGDVVEYVGTVIDVTERKRAEEALRRSENYLAEAQRLSHTGSWARSLATGEITYWSEECYRVLGFDPHAGLPQFKTFLQRVYPEDQDKVRKTAATATHEKVKYEVDYRIVHPGGQIRDVQAVGHPVFGPSGDLVEYVGTVIDVTERKRAEEALQASERELRLITESIPGMIVVNSPEGDNEYANQRLLDFLGKKLADLNELKWLSLVHPEDADSVMNKWLHAVKIGRPMDVVYRIRRADGVYRWFQSRVEPLVDVQGRILRWYGLVVDVDDQVKAEEALRKSQADLAHVSRVTTMGELTASIAHEVNQPLTAVVNNANACISLLPNGAPNLEEVRQALTEMIEDADRASGVIARVRQLAKRAPVEKSLLDLREVVQEVLALARYESSVRQVTIRTDLSTDLPFVLGDRVQLQQVLLNLVINGMDAMNQVEESKRVLIVGGRPEIQDGVTMALVSVRDSGTGFKPKEMDKLFEAFYTTKPQGMGMGLAISRSIIETHGGRLWAEPNQGPGATFVFSLPVVGNVAS